MHFSFRCIVTDLGMITLSPDHSCLIQFCSYMCLLFFHYLAVWAMMIKLFVYCPAITLLLLALLLSDKGAKVYNVLYRSLLFNNIQ